MPDRRFPLWLYPNLLSLDAPLVAVSWLWVFAKTWGIVYMETQYYIVLGLAVWAIYVFDRLFDAALRSGAPESLEARHLFHLRNKRMFIVGGILAAVAAVVITLVSLPILLFSYALFGGVLVLAFFALNVFGVHGKGEIPYAKNIVAGLTFAYGTAVAAHVSGSSIETTGIRFLDVMLSREVLAFGVLCIVNMTAIDIWERARQSKDLEQNASAELSITLPLVLVAAASLVFALAKQEPIPSDHEVSLRAFYYTILTSSALLYVLNRTRARFGVTELRVLADAALLAPIVVFLLLMRPG